MVARLLEGGEEPGALSRGLQSGQTLRVAWDALPAAQRDTIQRQIGPQAFQELLAISQEADPEMFYEGLLAFGVRQEQGDHLEGATRTYAAVSGAASLQSIQRRAQERLNAVLGQGAVGPRAEFLLRRLSREACEPTSLLAMGAAGALFKVTRLAALSRLAATPAGNFLTRGFGARALASTAAFMVEAPAFTLTGRLANEAFGNRQDWSRTALGRDLASSFLTLGGLKLTGWATGAAFNRLHGINPLTGQVQRLAGLSGLTQQVLPSLGMWGGIMLGHGLEERFGLREHRDGATSMIDSLAMLLQFHAAGGLTRHAFGERFHAWEQGIESQTARLGEQNRGNRGGRSSVDAALSGIGPQLAAAGNVPAESDAEPLGPQISMMSNQGEGKGRRGRKARDLSAAAARPGREGARSNPVPPQAAPEAEALDVRAETERRLALFDEHRRLADQGTSSSVPVFAAALRFLRDHPEAARDALIGRRNLNSQALNDLYQALRPQGLEILTNPEIRRVLIPNRGEIAVRLARGIRAETWTNAQGEAVPMTPIVLVPTPELNHAWVREIRSLGGEVREVTGETAEAAYQNAYVSVENIAAAAISAEAQAIHPGYGYRSESPELARKLHHHGIVLIGPSQGSMESAGDKDVAKAAFQKAGVPVVTGTKRGYTNTEQLLREIQQEGLHYPLRLKAVGGGGGRGQATVHNEAELREKFPGLSLQVLKTFGNGSVMAEQFISRFQHVEFQIMADRFGNVIHLGERECTLQERDQKLIEIHPAAIFERFPGLRERMAEASVNAARAVNYTGHGTVEFMVDPDTGKFYAMEVNARIQVEHRVSEAVTGFDLVREAIQVARGQPLSVRQSDIQPRGAAVEVRLKAVDPEKRNREGNAVAAPGLVDEFSIRHPETGAAVSDFELLKPFGIFVETSVRPGDRVPNVDPMIAKIIVTGSNRLDAIDRAAQVLYNTRLSGSEGFKSDLSRQRQLLETETVRLAGYDNRFVQSHTQQGFENRAVLPHSRQGLLLNEGVAVPVHFEVASHQPVPEEAVARTQEALRRWLRDEETPFDPGHVQGPLAELVRTDQALRRSLQEPGSGEARSVWTQLGEGGQVRQLVIFEGHRPQRILLAHRARLTMGGRVVPVAYDIQFPAEGRTPPTVEVYQQGTGNNLYMVRSKVEAEVRAEQGNYRVLATSAAELNLQIVPLQRQRALEIRDRQGNLLLALSPERVMDSPAQRLLALFELQNQKMPEFLRTQTARQIAEVIQKVSALPRGHEIRERTIRELGSTPVSLIARLLHLMGQQRPMEERAFLGEIMARREISGFSNRHEILDYQLLEPLLPESEQGPKDPWPSGVRFVQTTDDGQRIPRLQIRSRAVNNFNLFRTLQEAVAQLRQLQARFPESRDNVIQIAARKNEILGSGEQMNEFLRESLREVLGESFEELKLKRVSFVIDREGDYPNYRNFRRVKDAEANRTGPFVEDTRYRDVHPMLGHLIELRRLDAFNLERELDHSGRFTHIYFGTNKETPTLKAGEDQRLFGLALIPEAEIIRDSRGELQEIPRIEAGFTELVRAMHDALEGREGKRLHWNRMFLNIQPMLAVTDNEVAAYAEQLAIRHSDGLRGLGLEKVVVKGRILDNRLPEGFRTILVRITNPTGFRFEPTIHNIVRARVREQDGVISNREVLVRNGTYERWLEQRLAGNHDAVIPRGEWAPADIPIRPATPAEIREQQARSRGAVWAYRIPDLIAEVAEEFRVQNGLGLPRPPGSERPESSFPSSFVELDLDPKSVSVDPRTQMLDYNRGELIPAQDEQGAPRPFGQNQAGVVVGLQTDHLASGQPVQRVVLMGDLTHVSRGSLSANECARINAAIRYAARAGIPVDWYAVSSGAEIHEQRGVENLDATASTVREILLHGRSLGVPINIVVDDVNIGAQSYWNSLASIIHDTGGVLIMTPRGSMALTGPDAWTAAMRSDTHSEDLPAEARRFYPHGLQSLAGYHEIHGPNGEAMALAPNLAAATELLLRHHYFSYTSRGEIVSHRGLGEDPYDRDITTAPSTKGRRAGDEIQAILTGRAGNREAILEALRDQGSPPPLRWWSDAQGIRYQPGANGLMPQRFTTVIQEMQIGGQPTMVIFPPLGSLAPADSEIIGRALFKANGRMPVLIIGSLKGFNGDPRSMENRQLFGGATIAEAIVHHRGPITVVDMGYIIGGTFVVVSKQLNPHLRMLALEGSHAQVIGGPSAAKVVFRSRIRRAADRDPRVLEAKQAMDQATAEQQEATRENYQAVRRQVIAEFEQREGAAFDQVHSVQRATQVGALDEVVPASRLREAIIRQQQAALRAYRLDSERAADQALSRGLDQGLELPASQATQAMIESLSRIYGVEGAKAIALDLSEGLRQFADAAGPDDSGPKGGGTGPGGGEPAPP